MPIAKAMGDEMQIIIFGGSLATILGIFALARALKLGGRPTLNDATTAQKVAEEIENGFEAVRVSISRTKDAALLRAKDGRVMLVKRHGSHFVGRILSRQSSAREEVDALVVIPGAGENQFGSVKLRLDDAASWADTINRLQRACNA